MIKCPICKEEYYSVFDIKYIERMKGCYNCITDDIVVNDIFDEIEEGE